ncbi:reprolysin-like metallopeptidase [Phenylobacterium sp.]|uniref:reprolysin-like metallopeptidase n=1 Tax=Phenylobacterium sp. TaxID=1871053 RepID=UPI003BA9E3DE
MANPTPSTSPFPQTGDLIIDAMTTGFRWTLGADRTIDWSISGGFAGEFWSSPTLVQQHAAAMLDTFAYYANVRFTYVGSFSDPAAAAAAGSEINFFSSTSTTAFSSSNVWGRAFFPTTIGEAYPGAAGDVILNQNSPANSLPTYAPGSAGWFLFIHEIGHALGLKHPFDDGGTGRPTVSDLGLPELDIDWATMMAYGDDYNYNFRDYDPATPMVLDVLALQYLYGPNMSTNAGDGVYNLSASNRYVTVWDAGGQDLISANNSDRGWYIYMPDEQISNLSPARIGYAMPLSEIDLSSPRSLTWFLGNIEDAVGSSFADEIYGSVLNNAISGLGGDDYILGWDGADTIDGGGGNDEIFGGIGDDLIGDTAGGSNYLRGDEGNDRILGGTDFDDINGNMGNDTAFGGSGNDWVVGGKDNDSLDGGAGNDLVYGNLGSDTCFGGDGNDTVRGGQGEDQLQGGAGNDYLSGDRENDTLTGGSGADIFHSHSEAGVDRITDFNRGEGDQIQLLAGSTYTVAQVGADTVISIGSNGAQLILAGVSMSSLTGGWITA